MSDELAARRFEKAEFANKSRASDMLNKVLADIEAGFAPDHVMVLCCTDNEDGTVFNRYQAGSYNAVGRMGMLVHFQMIEASGTS